MHSTKNTPLATGVEVLRDGAATLLRRLNAGSGRTLFSDCVNVDLTLNEGADFACDLNGRLPFNDDTFDSVWCSHTLEHLTNPLGFMQELHRVCAPGAVAIFKVPYGSSDNAWTDPTHVRAYFLDSFGYFSQAAYVGADYGYRGDWAVVERELLIREETRLVEHKDNLDLVLSLVMTQRNIVEEMKCILRCVKPAREPGQAHEAAPITFRFHPPQKVNQDGRPGR